jgi:quercetin dioxygenase-like cupin family protein
MPETIRVGGLELRFLHDKSTTNGALDMFEMTVQPDARMPVPHYHRDWEETVYGLAGVLTMTVNGEAVDVPAGGSVFIPRGVVHGFVNRGTEPARCLCVLTPGVLGPAYFREIGAALMATPPDPAVLGAIMSRHGLVPVPG